jgi:hypothetical protein
MKKVISFSVWGTQPDYLVGAEKNALLAPSIYPGWETWFYVEEGTKVSLEDKATKVIYYKAEPGSDGMFQRFRPMLDDSVDVFISRDTDSRLSDREYQAVTAWLESDKQFHAMRDHPAHAVPVLGGMWGAKRYGLANLAFLYDNLTTHKNANYFDDQRGLASMYGVLSSLFLEHDDAGRYKGMPFPQHDPMTFGSFVGERITPDDKPGRV